MNCVVCSGASEEELCVACAEELPAPAGAPAAVASSATPATSAFSRFVSDGPDPGVFAIGVAVLAAATLVLAWLTRQDVEPIKVAGLVVGPVLTSFLVSQRVSPAARVARHTVFLAAWTVLTVIATGALLLQDATGQRPKSETIASGLSVVQAASAAAEERAVPAIHAVSGETADAATHRMLVTMASIVRHRNAANAAVAARLHDLDLAHMLSPANLVDDAARQRGHAAVAEWQASLRTVAQNEADVWAATTALVGSLPTGMQFGASDALDIARHARDASLQRWLTAEKEAADISGQLLDVVDAAKGGIVLREGMLDVPADLKRGFQRADARLAILAEVEAGERATLDRLASSGAVQLEGLPARWSRRDVAANGIAAMAHALNGATVDSPLPTPVVQAVHSSAPLHAVLPTLHVAQWHHDKDTQDVLAKLGTFDREAAMSPVALADPARRAATRDAIRTARADMRLLPEERQHYLEAVRNIVASLPADIRSEPARAIDEATRRDTATTAYLTASETQLGDMVAMLDFADIHTGAMQLRGGRLDLPDSLGGPYETLSGRLAADARRARTAADALASSDHVIIAQVDQAFAGSGLAYRH